MLSGTYFTVPFEMGNVVVHTGEGGRVSSIGFDLDGRYAPRRSASKLGIALTRYFEGNDVAWEVELDLKGLTRFGQRVYERVARIPFGTVSTYGEIAAEVGCVGGARAVGQAMAKNRFPLVLPCHRVISCGGSIGGFSSGIELKRYLLSLEGLRL